MTDAPRYTTQLQAGLGLLPETQKLLSIWEPGMTGPDLLKAALTSGEFPNVTARRLRNVVLEAFSPRYLVDDAAPARLLKVLSASGLREDLRSLCFLFTSRANQILADFVREVYWARYAAGGLPSRPIVFSVSFDTPEALARAPVLKATPVSAAIARLDSSPILLANS